MVSGHPGGAMRVAVVVLAAGTFGCAFGEKHKVRKECDNPTVCKTSARPECTNTSLFTQCRCICGVAGTKVRCPVGGHMGVDSQGGWKLSSRRPFAYFLDESLARAVADLVVNESSLLELGAGTGCYQAALARAGVRTLRAYDYSAPKQGNPLVSFADLSVEQHFKVHDWVMSLEVGEHIPVQSAPTFVRNIDRHNRRGVILSWSNAVGGLAHVNPLPLSAVAGMFAPLGYFVDDVATRSLQNAATIGWFKDTLMVLRRSV